jgi:hypothetical protein
MPFLKLIAVVSLLFAIVSCSTENTPRNWKGSAILGNGNVCAVYSDDERFSKSGIQHFYYKNYTADYISSSSCDILLENRSILKGEKSIGMENFYTTSTKIKSGSNHFEIQANSFPELGVVLSLIRTEGLKNSTYEYKINFRKEIQTDQIIELESFNIFRNFTSIKWNNDVFLIIGVTDTSSILSFTDSILTCKGKLHSDTLQILISASDDRLDEISNSLTASEIYSDYWEKWINSGAVPNLENQQYLDYYKRNLYAVKASNLHGMIPADITGQFVTNNMPQLYPRDAMMIARVFIKTGHLDEAKQIIDFWANQKIPRKSKGEWFARYDAYGNAVDAGSGARYDEPEWDANSYFIRLADMYYKKTGTWLVDSLQIYETSDFLVNNLDKNNLLFEGGIIEWSGYLPSTNMTAAAALKTASEMAQNFGNVNKSKLYANASQNIAKSLNFMFDKTRNTYTDVRFAGKKTKENDSMQYTSGDTLYLWDTSANFGILWGYPDHNEMKETNKFYSSNTVKHHGGLQYFDAPDPGLAAYGNDMFFFTTAARAQYLAMNNNITESENHINWMINNSNSYGLMPERIYLNNQDCSDASPLSWCCAEFGAALLEYHVATKSK